MRAMFVNEAMRFQRVQGNTKEGILGRMGIGQTNIKMTWGKHKGKTVGEIYAEDPQYIAWLADNGSPRKGQEKLFVEIKRLRDAYWKGIADKRATEGGTFYGDPGDIYQGAVEVISLKYFTGEYGASYRFRTKAPEHWFEFYMGLSRLEKILGLKPNPELGYVDDQELKRAIFALKDQTIDIKGKVKFHREVLGHNYTNLNYVTIFPATTINL